jgi:hypothetical protein
MVKSSKGWLKRIKALARAVMLATLFTALRASERPGAVGGEAKPGSEAITAVVPAGKKKGEDSPAASQKADCAAEEKSLEQKFKDLEGELTSKNRRIAELERSAGESNSRAGQLGESLKQAISGYKNLLIRANPEIVPELISGETLEALDGSMAKARELTGQIRARLGAQAESRLSAQTAAQAQKTRIPAGAPARGAEDYSGLSSREKISRGIGRQ